MASRFDFTHKPSLLRDSDIEFQIRKSFEDKFLLLGNVDKFKFIEIKNFCSLKDKVKRMRLKGKNSAHHISDKCLYPEYIFKTLPKFNKKKTK